MEYPHDVLADLLCSAQQYGLLDNGWCDTGNVFMQLGNQTLLLEPREAFLLLHDLLRNYMRALQHAKEIEPVRDETPRPPVFASYKLN